MKINKPITSKEVHFSQDIEIISTTNLKGIIETANEDFINISGFDWDEIEGKNHNLVRHPDMPAEAFADLWQSCKANKPWMGMVKNRCKNGDYYWVDAYVRPLYVDGKVEGFQSVRAKPEKEWVDRADKLYTKIMASKSEDDKRRSKLDAVKLSRLPLGISEKMTLAFSTILVPLLLVMGVMGSVGLPLLIGSGVIALIAAYMASRYTLRHLLKLSRNTEAVAKNSDRKSVV